MPEVSAPNEQPFKIEHEPFGPVGERTAPGAQRELQFEDNGGERLAPEETVPRTNVKRGGDFRAEPPPETSPAPDPDAGTPLILGEEAVHGEGPVRHVCRFAMALQRLARPYGDREQKQAHRAVETWHRDLLGLLSRLLSRSSAQVRLRYWTDPAHAAGAPTSALGKDPPGDNEPRLHVGLVVEAWAQAAETAETRASRLSEELSAFLLGEGTGMDGPYEFRPVTSEAALRRWLVPFRGGESPGSENPNSEIHEVEGARLSRASIPLPASDGPGIGFAAGQGKATKMERSVEEPVAEAVPTAAGSVPERHLSRLTQAMLQEGPSSLVDVSLRPTSLQPAERSRLRTLARGEATAGTMLSAGEEEAVVSLSEALLRQAGSCFEIDVTLAQGFSSEGPSSEAQRTVSCALLAAVEQCLFGGRGQTQAEKTLFETRDGLLCPTSPEGKRPGAGDRSDAGGRSDAGDPARPGTENRAPSGRVQTSPAGQSRLRRLCGTEGAARQFRLPIPTPETIAGVNQVRPAAVYVPPSLSGEGPLLGSKEGQTKTEAIRLQPEDMFHHVYILGQTGTGKTTMLGSMIEERLKAGAGLGLIDPHGDLYDQVRRAVPAGRQGDVVLFDPANEQNDTALNLLEYDPERPRQRSTLINELLQVLDQEYDLRETGGPIFERYMRNALLLVMDDPEQPGTLMDVVRLFQDREYREAFLDACDNERVIRFWEEAENTPTTGELPSPQNMSIYVTSKLSRFLDDDYLRSLFSQRRSTIDFRQVIDSGKILLVKMQKGRLGQIGIRMFGTIIVTRLMMAALTREEIPEEERRDFYLFVDEFQNFTTPTIVSLLSEARKFRLSLTLANQTLYQLEDEIADAVLGNAGSLVALRPGVKDFGRIEPYVSPPFSREEITNLPNYTAVGRLLAGGEPTRPFLFETTPRL